MNIVVVGKGAREDAISQKLSYEGNDVFLINNNNIRNNNVEIELDDFNGIKGFCIEKEIDLIVVGPEDLLDNGIVDYFNDTNIKIFGPSKKASQLESSKIFAKEFMIKNAVSTANYKSFMISEKEKIISKINIMNGVLVLKYDGLAAGKGVFVSDNIDSAYKNLEIIEKKYSNNGDLKLIIEDRLIGREISIMAVTDSKSIRIFQASQDYKLSNNNNLGLNTGGMGAITPLDFLNEDIMKDINDFIIQPTLLGLQNNNINYNGFLYFGIILTKDGPFLLEYNIRLGDPETQVLLPSLKSSLTGLINATIDNKLHDFEKLIFDDKYYMSLVLASDGYPLKYNINEEITIDKSMMNCDIYYAGVKRKITGELLTNGGRVLNIVSSHHDINKLKNSVYSCAKSINFKSKYFRDDIGTIY